MILNEIKSFSHGVNDLIVINEFAVVAAGLVFFIQNLVWGTNIVSIIVISVFMITAFLALKVLIGRTVLEHSLKERTHV